MPASVKSPAVLRSPFLWVGVLMLLALIGALVFSDGVAELARFSADYQRRIQQSLSTSLRDIQSGSGSLALWTLAIVCFGYGVVHTLGPGHGKAVVVAYFLDSTRPHAWIEGVFAGSLDRLHPYAGGAAAGRRVEDSLRASACSARCAKCATSRSSPIIADPADRPVAAAGRDCTGRPARAWTGHDHGHHHDHDHRHTSRRSRTVAGWLLLTAAGIAPCAGALVVILLSIALGVLWAGVVGVIAIALGMAITLSAIGMASMVAHRLIIGDGRSARRSAASPRSPPP